MLGTTLNPVTVADLLFTFKNLIREALQNTPRYQWLVVHNENFEENARLMLANLTIVLGPHSHHLEVRLIDALTQLCRGQTAPLIALFKDRPTLCHFYWEHSEHLCAMHTLLEQTVLETQNVPAPVLHQFHTYSEDDTTHSAPLSRNKRTQ